MISVLYELATLLGVVLLCSPAVLGYLYTPGPCGCHCNLCPAYCASSFPVQIKLVISASAVTNGTCASCSSVLGTYYLSGPATGCGWRFDLAGPCDIVRFEGFITAGAVSPATELQLFVQREYAIGAVGPWIQFRQFYADKGDCAGWTNEDVPLYYLTPGFSGLCTFTGLTAQVTSL